MTYTTKKLKDQEKHADDAILNRHLKETFEVKGTTVIVQSDLTNKVYELNDLGIELQKTLSKQDFLALLKRSFYSLVKQH